VRGKIPHSTNDSTIFQHSDKAKNCSIVLSFVLCGSEVTHYSTKVLCHYDQRISVVRGEVARGSAKTGSCFEVPRFWNAGNFGRRFGAPNPSFS